MCNETIIYLCSVAATAIHRRPRVSDSLLLSDLAQLCTGMGIASQTVKACAQYFYSKSSHRLMYVCLPRVLFYPLQYRIHLC
ncbi:uncharacterized protein TNCT_398661 [Trichonephila clavata]|uniref:Uncharacterized protein n=1 Tax=Trichonephila clavata TaxID=2740835 RepID=A0A8X6L7C4_TRICU|nr:uncharacterized protein TNCT_398661 [Trichonephila clavata]